jgi:translocation and assembly module TamB
MSLHPHPEPIGASAGLGGHSHRPVATQPLPVRIVRFVGVWAGVLLTFVVSAVTGALLHLNTPRVREWSAHLVNGILAPLFQGTIHIDRIGGLGLFGVSDTDVTIDDPSGRPVIVGRGVRASIATLIAARSALLARRGPVTIDLPGASIEQLDVRLDTNASGQLDLVDAFAPKTPSAPGSPDGRGVRVLIRHIALAHGWAHGRIAGAPPLDVDVRDLRGAMTYTADVLEGDVQAASIAAHGIANGADIVGSLRAHVRDPSDPDGKLEGRVVWEGSAGGVAHSIRATLENDKLDATVDAPHVEPAALRTLWAASPIERMTTAHVEAHGTLPDLRVDVDVSLGQAGLHAGGLVGVGEEKRATVSFEAHDVDIREFASTAPASRLGANGTLTITSGPDGRLAAEAAVRFLGGTIGADQVPSASIHAMARRSNDGALTGRADVVVDEPLAPTRLSVSLAPSGRSFALAFQLSSDIAELDRVPLLHHAVQGTTHVDGHGTFDLGTRVIDAQVQTSAARLVHGSTSVDRVTLDARARGGIVNPRIDVTMRARTLAVQGRHVSTLVVRAAGQVTSSHVTVSAHSPDLPDVDASAEVGLSQGLSLATLRVALSHADERAVITADRVVVGGGAIRVDGARVEGLGPPVTGTLASSPSGTIRVVASAPGIDLGRVGRLVHFEDKLRAGTLAFDVDLHVYRNGAHGRGDVTLEHVVFGTIGKIAGAVDLRFEGRTIAGNAHVEVGDVGSIDVDAPKLDVSGTDPLSFDSWRRTWGEIAVDAHVDLAKAASLLPPDDVPLSGSRGDVFIKAHVARDAAHGPAPEVGLTMATRNLALAPKMPTARQIDGVTVVQPPPWRLEGVDFNLDGTLDGRTGKLDVSTQIYDRRGDLAHVHVASAAFPYAEALQNDPRLTSDLRRVPFAVRVTVPERGLDRLPSLLMQNYVHGKVQGELSVTGTMVEPALKLAATVKDSRFSSDSELARPLDFDIAAHYDGRHGGASVKARSGDEDRLDLEAEIDAAIAPFLDGTSSPAWSASARAHFSQFPLEAIAVLDDKMVSGRLSGDCSLARLHDDARADATLHVDDFRVGSFAYPSAQAHVSADGHTLAAVVRIDQTDGFAQVDGHAEAAWGAAMVPSLDPTKPLAATFDSKNFRIGALLPLIDGTFDELDGRVDAGLHIELDPKTRGAKLSGDLGLTRGTLEASAGGGEFHDIAAKVHFAPDGTIRVDPMTAAGVTGKLDATAVVQFDGTHLQSARGVVVIPSRSGIPVSAGGAEIGTVEGRFEIAEVTSDQGATTGITVKVPQLRVTLPDGSTNDAIALGPVGNVRLGAHRGLPTTFVLIPIRPVSTSGAGSSTAAAKRLKVGVDLADVRVVRGTDVKIDLDGHLTVETGASTDVTGRINLRRGGVVSVEGKSFTVESGTVTMIGPDPSNPEVLVKAGWSAPDGTVVYANFVGPLKTGKVTLSSEPQLPQQDIVELLLFGSVDGQQAGAPSATTENSAIGTAGGQAAQPLNHMLNQLGLGAVSAKIDTTESTPKPEVVVQIARDISLQIAEVLGQVPPGVNPDTTLLTVDWRFLTKWSLATTVGNLGTTIFDLLWQKSY